MIKKSLAPIGAISAIALLALTGCGSDNNDKASGTTTVTATATATATVTQNAAAPGTGGNPGSDLGGSSDSASPDAASASSSETAMIYDFTPEAIPGTVAGPALEIKPADGLLEAATKDSEAPTKGDVKKRQFFNSVVLKAHKMNSDTCAIDLDYTLNDAPEAKAAEKEMVASAMKDPDNARMTDADKQLDAYKQLLGNTFPTEVYPMSEFNENITASDDKNDSMFISDDHTKAVFTLSCAASTSDDDVNHPLKLEFGDVVDDKTVAEADISATQDEVSIFKKKTSSYETSDGEHWVRK